MNKKISILAIEHPLERVAFKMLIALFVALLLGYLYFVGASVLNIMARREADARSARLASATAIMEKEYFALQQAVNPSIAEGLGLISIDNEQYVYRQNPAAATIAINAI